MYNTLKGSVCNFIDEMKNVGRERERERGRGREREGELTCIIHGIGETIVPTWAEAESGDCITVTGH